MPTVRWEFAEVAARGANSYATFSHRPPRKGEFWALLKQLGDEGWAMVGVAAAGEVPMDFTWRYVSQRLLS